jgi:DNA-binding MarR family transcriptional regulator
MPNSAFGFTKPEDSPGFLLWQIMITWQRLIKKALDAHHISHAQFVIMAILLWFEENNYEKTQSLIAKWSKLVAQGLASRTEHARDTRAKSITLTKNGKILVRKLIHTVETIDAKFFGKLAKNDQQSLIHILGKLMSVLEKSDSQN